MPYRKALYYSRGKYARWFPSKRRSRFPGFFNRTVRHARMRRSIRRIGAFGRYRWRKSQYAKAFRRQRRKRRAVINIRSPLMPPKAFVRMRYQGNAQSSVSTAGAPTVLTFNASSIHNPEPSGTRQPDYFDQWAKFYGRYRVLGCLIKVRCSNPATSNTQIVSLHATDETLEVSPAWTNFLNFQRHKRMPDMKSGWLRPFGENDPNDGGNIRWLKMYRSTRSMVGKGHDVEELEGVLDDSGGSTDPAHMWTYKLTHCAADFATTVTLNYHFVMEFNVLLSDLKLPVTATD